MKWMISCVLTCALLLTLLTAWPAAAEPPVAEPVVAAGWDFCAALDEHGTVWTWGMAPRRTVGMPRLCLA